MAWVACHGVLSLARSETAHRFEAPGAARHVETHRPGTLPILAGGHGTQAFLTALSDDSRTANQLPAAGDPTIGINALRTILRNPVAR